MASQRSRYSLNKNKYLNDTERERLEFLARSNLENSLRPCLLLLMGLHTGARATELLGLKFEDFEDQHKTVFIHGIKGSNDREIPLPNWLYRYVHHLPPNSKNLLFPFSYNRLRQIWELYRPVNKKFHSLRHTFAIRLYKKTKDLRLVQVALGHRNISNTMIYADYVYSQQELRKLIL